MRTGGARSSPLLLTALLWSAVGCANLLLLILGPFGPAQATNVVGTTVCGLVLSSAMALATRPLIARGGRGPALLLALLACAGGACLWAFDTALQGRLSGVDAMRRSLPESFVRLRLNLVYYELLFLLQASVMALLALRVEARDRERQLGAERLAAQQARLAALRLQLNPHFLFNTLNAISTLVGEGAAADAEEMIARLSAFLRTSLECDGAEMTTLERELETAQAYLDIEAVRFGERMVVRYACDEGLSEARIPGLILQPLIENSVKHGVARNIGEASICITARRCDERLVVSVEDHAALSRVTEDRGGDPQGGVGLRNVAGRLRELYGDEARLEAGRIVGGFRATLNLPLAPDHRRSAR